VYERVVERVEEGACEVRKLAIVAAIMLSGQIHDRGTRMVYVQDCHGRFSPIWVDKTMTEPMSNPLVVESGGKYEFWAAPGSCVFVEAK
jgi:hypothetical protein